MKHMPVTQVCVLGERVSGTCFVQSLLSENTPLKVVSPYGHKHFYQDTDKIRKDGEKVKDTLFLFISRDLVDWLNSFKNNTFHADKPIRNCNNMSAFLRMEWKCVFDSTSGTPQTSSEYGTEMLCERNPSDGTRFQNVIKMRNSKMWHFLEIEKHVDNYVHVRYEDARDNPEDFVKAISQKFGIKTSKVFNPIDTVRGKGRVPYVRKTYPGMSAEDTKFVLDNVDVELESQLGYL
jgi:hypothetical protein